LFISNYFFRKLKQEYNPNPIWFLEIQILKSDFATRSNFERKRGASFMGDHKQLDFLWFGDHQEKNDANRVFRSFQKFNIFRS